VVESPSDWDAKAGAANWIRPGERIVGRGGPDPRVVFAPQDLLLVLLSLVWTGFFVFAAFNSSPGRPAAGLLWVSPFLAFGSYIVLGRFIVKPIGRHRTRYALTNQRAVEISGSGRVLGEAALHAPLEIRHRRDGRHGTAIWTVDQPARAGFLARSARNLAPEETFSFGLASKEPVLRGSVSGRAVRLLAGSGGRNSWRLNFEGGIVVNGPGCWLTGMLGPSSFTPGFSALWLGFVSLFFLGGTVGFVTDLATGHGFALLPACLIPAVMLVGFFAITESGAKNAQSEWARTDLWLRSLLEVPDAPRL
jgi:hypothetical protein